MPHSLLKNTRKINRTKIIKKTLTLNGSPDLIFFCRNFSKLGGATKTTYGFKSDDLNNFKLCG